MARNPYGNSTTSDNARLPYTRGTEPDMRFEMNATLDGIFPEVAKKQPAVLRRMRLDEVCPCVDSVTGEPDLDTFCPLCHGEGYMWNEILIDVYSIVLRSSVGLSSREDLISPGLLNIPLVTFYTRSSVAIQSQDKIVEMELEADGTLQKPYRRKQLYRIGTAIDFRSDHGKLEYWKLDCYGEQRKFLNGIEE